MSDLKYEKLDIVFGLEVIPATADGMDQVTKSRGINDAQAFRTIVSTMRELGEVPELKEQQTSMSAEAYLAQIEAHGKWSRTVEANGLSFRFGTVTALKHSFLSIQEIEPESAKSWRRWVEPFFSEDNFIQAWVSDRNYDYWQNASDPLQYQAAQRNYAHLSLKSSGLPPPLEQLEIDTSQNPGRWSLRSGYVEAIGARMWLGKPFWAYVGPRRKLEILSAEWLTVKELENGVVEVVASDRCFCDESTALLQNRLRSVLYG